MSHCGSLLGQFGANSYTTGVLSQVGRTLPMKGANVKVFDQVTTVSFPGSSGGGMYLKESGEYIGMLTQGVMQLQGFNFIVPVRRIHAWAKQSKIEWAIDPTVPMPSLKEIDAIPVEDAGQSPGGYPDAIRPPHRNSSFKPPFNFDDAINWVDPILCPRGASVLVRLFLPFCPIPASCDRQHLSRVARGSATRPLYKPLTGEGDTERPCDY